MLVKKKLYFVSLLILISIIHTNAQYSLVKASLDTNSIEIGDQIYLNLSIEKPASELIKFPILKDTIVKGLEVLEVMPVDTQILKNNKLRLVQKIRITAFDPGLIAIPAFIFKRNNDTLFSNSLELTVNPVKLDSLEMAKIDTSQVMDIFDIKEPLNTPLTFKEFIQRFYPYILGFFGLLLLVLLILYIIKLRAQNRPLIRLPEKPKEAAHIIAFRALDQLKNKKLWQTGFEKEYYLELTDIIRQYIEDRFNVHTFERTSQEILDSIKSQKLLDHPIFEELKSLLTLADLAKFAKYKPLPNENELSLKSSYSFVENTKPEEKVNVAEQFEESGNETVLNSDKSIDAQKN